MSDGMTEVFVSGTCRWCKSNEHSSAGCRRTEFTDNAQNLPFKVEFDPNGISQHEPGAKLDAGKTKADLVMGGFSRALMAVSEVGTYGANKYTEEGWMQVPNGIKRYGDAAMRHYLKRKAGEEIDPDTELLHLAHEAWNKLAELELTLRRGK